MTITDNDNHAQLPEYVKSTLLRYEVIDFQSPNTQVFQVSGGTINSNFKVSSFDKNILVKVLYDRLRLPIDRKHIFALQEELAILGLAPQPIFLSEQEDIYCETWIETRHIDDAQKVEAFAQSLATLHGAFVSAPPLPLVAHWEVYLQHIDLPSLALQQDFKRYADWWEQYVANNKSEFVLCHNDLHLSHLSARGGPLLDWEYAGFCSPYFDLASCAKINNLNEAENHALCKFYAEFASQESQYVLEKVAQIKPITDFTYTLWSLSVGLTTQSIRQD